MKQDNLHDAITMLDDNLIEQTAVKRNSKKRKRIALTKWVAFAASVCLAITGAVSFGMWGSSPNGNFVAQAHDLMEGIEPNSVQNESDLSQFSQGQTDFALRLFKASLSGDKNTLISPLSVLSAMSMTANGADGNTLTQMEQTLGLPINKLNSGFYSYMSTLPNNDKGKLSLANSIWFADDGRITVNKDFLQTNADYFGASTYKAPFNDDTVKDINNWVKHNTDGMIPEVLDEIPGGAIMYLVNALAFDAKWQQEYIDADINNGKFKTADKRQVSAKYMTSIENTYLEDDNAVGFVKYYKGNRFAFAALLPDEDVTINEYVNSLTTERLAKILSTRKNMSVFAGLPKFETSYDVEMADILSSMGMSDAFNGDKANFNRIGNADGNIYISRVLHKTFISVGAKGTKAAAATTVELKAEGFIETDKVVYLDRPFVYMIFDCQTNTPFFIGTMMDVTK